MPQIKKRSSLRFFPNIESRHDNRDFGKGLIITLKADGQRVVSRIKYTHDSSSNKGLPRKDILKDAKSGLGPTNSRYKWMLCQSDVQHTKQRAGPCNLGILGLFPNNKKSPCNIVKVRSVVGSVPEETNLESLVGSRAWSTFELGESLSSRGLAGLEILTRVQNPVQGRTAITQGPDKTKTESFLALVNEVSVLSELDRESSRSSDLQFLGGNWFMQLRDEGRVEIMGLSHSPCDFVRGFHGDWLGRWSSGMRKS